jgi:Ethanolamine utilization protein EutJ (predicted chaperonin)
LLGDAAQDLIQSHNASTSDLYLGVSLGRCSSCIKV